MSESSSQQQTVRGYKLLQEIGSGAFGVVYRAYQPVVGREVAIKIIRPRYANHPDFIRRFEAEAQTVARLEHPYIVPLYDYWREPDNAYLVMRWLRGDNLEERLKDGPLSPEEAARVVDQVAAALYAAHRRHIIHRDVKAANILFDEEGNAYLSDFSVAKDLQTAEEPLEPGGSPEYLSPEQLLKEALSPQTDQYSLGIVIYQMLSGNSPFPEGTSIDDLRRHILNESLPLIASKVPGMPGSIDDVLQRATAKKPGDRFPDMLALARAFHQAVGTTSIAVDAGEETELAVEAEAALVLNPYKGLQAFQESDAETFFGREALVEGLLERLEEAGDVSRFLAVVGPSGSGKSSAVKAGLIPALRGGGISRSESWFITEMTPGRDPLQELAAALMRVAVNPPEDLLARLQEDERGLAAVLESILLADKEGETPQLLLLVDQFEELFTLTTDDAARDHFINSLLAALNEPDSRLRVITTLRADFYDRPLQVAGLGELLRQRTEVVLPLTPAELERAITQPAVLAGVSLEQGLLAGITADVSDQPGTLPLMQYALTELFERHEEETMTVEAYRAIGGVPGALGRRANEIYESLDPTEQEAARQLFLRLVTLGEGAEDTRRRVLREELEGISLQSTVDSEQSAVSGQQSRIRDQRSEISSVIDIFGQYRLLTFDRDPATRGPTVEVAHEALLHEWPQLRLWLEKSRADVRLQRLLAGETAEWQAAGQDDAYLLRGARLDQYDGWLEQTSVSLTDEEKTFLAASFAAREARLAEEEARRQRELEMAQQRAEEQAQAAAGMRRRAYMLGGVLIIALLLAIAAVFFAQQSNQNATVAQENANLAATREAEAVANADLASTSETNAVAEAQQRATAQAEADEQRSAAVVAQEEAVAEANIRATAETVAQEERSIAEEQREVAEEQANLARSRELAAAALGNLETDPELSILLALEGLSTRRSTETESALHQAIVASPLRRTMFIEGVFANWFGASPDGRIAYAAGSSGGTAWDTETGELLYRHPVPDGDWLNRPGFSADGTLLALSGESYDEEGETLPGEVTLADTQTGQELVKFAAHDSWIYETKFSPDGSLFATISDDLKAKVWDLEGTLEEETGQLVAEFCCAVNWNNGVAFRPGSEQLAINLGDGSLVVWDVATGETVLTLGPDILFSSDYSPDGQYLVTAGNAGNIEVWDADSGERLSRTVSHSGGAVTDVQLSPDGSQLVSTSNNGSIKLWRFSADGLEEIRSIPTQPGFVSGAAFSPDSRFLYTESASVLGGITRVWDISPAGSAELVAIEAHDGQLSDFHLRDDGSQLLTVGLDGMMRLWDTDSWEEINALQAHEGEISEVDVSPDGRMIATVSNKELTPKVWDATTWQQLFSLEGHEYLEFNEGWDTGVFAVHFSPDGQRLATAGADFTARVWDASNGDLLHTLAGHEDWVSQLVFSPDGDLLVTDSWDKSIKVWDAVDGQLLQTLISDPLESRYLTLAISPDGSRLAAGGLSQVIEMWQIPSGPWSETDDGVVPLYRVDSDAGKIKQINFSPDSKRLVVVGEAGLAEIRDTGTGDLLLGLQHPAAIEYAEFSADGKRLMTGDNDGIFRIWSPDVEELVALAQSRLTRSFTAQECQQYRIDPCPAGE